MSYSIDFNDYQWKVKCHHYQQFGHRNITAVALKLAEEAGEVAGAVIRHTDHRDERSWTPEIAKELGDLSVTMMMLCQSSGLSIERVMLDGCHRFLGRSWANIVPEDTNND